MRTEGVLGVGAAATAVGEARSTEQGGEKARRQAKWFVRWGGRLPGRPCGGCGGPAALVPFTNACVLTLDPVALMRPILRPGSACFVSFLVFFVSLYFWFLLSSLTSRYLNVPRLVSWLAARQYAPEGGFSGRTNKLVDGCYSHWVGDCWPLVEACLERSAACSPPSSLFSREGLIRYILSCCQDETKRGGLRDKPGR